MGQLEASAAKTGAEERLVNQQRQTESERADNVRADTEEKRLRHGDIGVFGTHFNPKAYNLLPPAEGTGLDSRSGGLGGGLLDQMDQIGNTLMTGGKSIWNWMNK
jgi:hypothetical protein